MNRKLIHSAGFVRAARRFVKRQPHMLNEIRDTLLLMERDAFDPKLRTHKLKGDLAGTWSCNAGYDLRIVFEFVEQEGSQAILLLSVGTHDEVY